MLVLQFTGNSLEKIIRAFRFIKRTLFLCQQSGVSMRLSNSVIILLCLACLNDLG